VTCNNYVISTEDMNQGWISAGRNCFCHARGLNRF